MRLHLVRHPKPVIEPGTCYGSSDLPVNAGHCDLVATALLDSLPNDAAVFSSPLRRCADLAAKLASGLSQKPVVFDERLVEMHFGQWELQPWSDIARCEIEAWANDVAIYRPGGGDSVLQMAARVRDFHDELLRGRHADAVIVCHAGTIRLLLACRLGLPLAEIARHAARIPHGIAYGAVISLDTRAGAGNDRCGR